MYSPRQASVQLSACQLFKTAQFKRLYNYMPVSYVQPTSSVCSTICLSAVYSPGQASVQLSACQLFKTAQVKRLFNYLPVSCLQLRLSVCSTICLSAVYSSGQVSVQLFACQLSTAQATCQSTRIVRSSGVYLLAVHRSGKSCVSFMELTHCFKQLSVTL